MTQAMKRLCQIAGVLAVLFLVAGCSTADPVCAGGSGYYATQSYSACSCGVGGSFGGFDLINTFAVNICADSGESACCGSIDNSSGSDRDCTCAPWQCTGDTSGCSCQLPVGAGSGQTTVAACPSAVGQTCCASSTAGSCRCSDGNCVAGETAVTDCQVTTVRAAGLPLCPRGKSTVDDCRAFVESSADGGPS